MKNGVFCGDECLQMKRVKVDNSNFHKYYGDMAIECLLAKEELEKEKNTVLRLRRVYNIYMGADGRIEGERVLGVIGKILNRSKKSFSS